MQLITEFSTVKITEVMVSKKIKFLSHQNMMDLEGNVSVIALFAKCFVLTYAEVEQSAWQVFFCLYFFLIFCPAVESKLTFEKVRALFFENEFSLGG